MTDPDHGAVADISEIEAVGFKTVISKGYYGVHELTEEVMEGMREFLMVAPAHNAPYLEAIEQFKKILPEARMVGAFETAFHTTIPLERKLYAVPGARFVTAKRVSAVSPRRVQPLAVC